MKRIIGIVFVLTILLTSCLSNDPYKEDSYERLSEILDAIEKKDKEDLKEVFSKYAIDNCGNLDKDIDELIDYFKGEVVSADISGHGMEKVNLPDGRSEMIMYVPCTVVTTEQTYYMYFTDYVIYTENRDKEGVLCLYIIKSEEHTAEYCYRFDSTEKPGINIGTPCVLR